MNQTHEQSPQNNSHLPTEYGCLLETPPKRIALVRALTGLGDILCTVPAFRALRAAFPQAEIVLIGLPSIKPLIKRFNQYIDRVLEFPGYPGLPEQATNLTQIPTFIQMAQNEQFDLAIQMHGNGVITNPLTVLLGARWNAGFFLPGQYCPDQKRFLPYIDDESEVRRYVRLLEWLGVPSKGTDLEFPLYEEDEQALREIAESGGVFKDAESRPVFTDGVPPSGGELERVAGGIIPPAISHFKTGVPPSCPHLFKTEEIQQLAGSEYVCVHPGASTESRCWQPEGFATVADAIAQMGYSIVLTGTASETNLTTTVASLMKAPSLNLAGRTSLGAASVLLRDSKLLICNDTGVSHLAAALKVNSVVIFTQSDPVRWAPLNSDRHRVICAPGISPEAIIAQAKDLLNQQSACVV